MKRLVANLRLAATMMRDGQSRYVAERLTNAMWSERRFIVMRRDLIESVEQRPTPVAFSIRPFEPDDIRILDGKPFSSADAHARSLRRRWIAEGLPGCHVATVKGEPCYMQWILPFSEQAAINAFFGNTMPAIDEHTVLMEGAYMAPRYRRLPIMPAAMARISDLGRGHGARFAIVAVSEDNSAMIKATEWAGFVPERVETEQRRLFRRLSHYAPLSERPSA